MDFIRNKLHAEFYVDNMRDENGHYFEFFNVFVRQVVSKKEFDASCLTWKKGDQDNDIATISDEALALLCFENQFEVWQDVWQKSNGEICPIPKNEPYPQEWISEKVTRYTTKKDANGEPIDSKDKSWTNEGFKRFNALFKLVKESRARKPNFIAQFVDYKKETMKKSSSTLISQEELTDVEDELFHNPEYLNRNSFTPPVQNEEQHERSGTRSKTSGRRQLDMEEKE